MYDYNDNDNVEYDMEPIDMDDIEILDVGSDDDGSFFLEHDGNDIAEIAAIAGGFAASEELGQTRPVTDFFHTGKKGGTPTKQIGSMFDGNNVVGINYEGFLRLKEEVAKVDAKLAELKRQGKKPGQWASVLRLCLETNPGWKPGVRFPKISLRLMETQYFKTEDAEVSPSMETTVDNATKIISGNNEPTETGYGKRVTWAGNNTDKTLQQIEQPKTLRDDEPLFEL